jgi:small subunit ribosomal protein S16
MFRVVVQDSRRTPTSGKLVARLGSYDPHAKTLIVDKEKAKFYLDHGAQPSERVARMLKSEGVKLPEWVAAPETKQRTVKNADKRRSTRPDVPVEETPAEPETPPEAEAPAEAPATEPEVSASEPEETAAEPAEVVKEEVEVTDAEPDSAPKEEAATEQTADTPEQT